MSEVSDASLIDLGHFRVSAFGAGGAGVCSRRRPSRGLCPGGAHVEGKFGSFWASDVWIYQQGATTIHLWLNPPGQDSTDGESVVVALDEPVVFIPDIVATLFGTEGSGSLHYIADGPVTVTSRTWTPGDEGGSYGLSLPGEPVGGASFAGSGQAGAFRVHGQSTIGLPRQLRRRQRVAGRGDRAGGDFHRRW